MTEQNNISPSAEPSAAPQAAGAAPAGVAFPKTIKSYVRRAGRTTTGQAKAFEDLGPRFLLNYRAEPFDATAAFGRNAPLILEIGFGMARPRRTSPVCGPLTISCAAKCMSQA